MENFTDIYTKALHYVRKSIFKETIPIKNSAEDIIAEAYILLTDSGEEINNDSLIKYCIKVFRGYKYEQIGIRFKQRHNDKFTQRSCKKCHQLKDIDNFRRLEDYRLHFFYHLNTCEECLRPYRKSLAAKFRESKRAHFNLYHKKYQSRYAKLDKTKQKTKQRVVRIRQEKSDAYIKKLIYARVKIRASFIDQKMICTLRELIIRHRPKEKEFFYDILLNKKHITEFDKINMHNILYIEERVKQMIAEIKERGRLYRIKWYNKNKKRLRKQNLKWFRKKMSEDLDFRERKINYQKEYSKKYRQNKKEEKSKRTRAFAITDNRSLVF